MSDQAIEQNIQIQNFPAPRISYADVHANIIHTEIVRHVSHSGQVLRWALLTLKNGFTVTGRPSVAVSPENDNVEIGEQVARENSFNEIWPLMGYALKDQLYRDAQEPPAPGAAHAGYSTMPPHQQRVVDEYAELSTKLLKLSAFTATDLFAGLPEAERRRLIAQLSTMDSYCTILSERIAAFR